MDLYIFSVVLGAAGTAAMAFLGFAGSHGGGHHGHDTAGHDIGVTHPGSHGHMTVHSDAASHAHAPHAHVHADGWKASLWSWLSPRVLSPAATAATAGNAGQDRQSVSRGDRLRVFGGTEP